MKNIKYLVFLLLFGCSVDKNLSDLNPAAKEVYRGICFTEKQLKRATKGKSHDYSAVDGIVNLSGIVPDNTVGWEIYYNVDKEDISLLKKWFDENKEHLSYYENDDINKFYFSGKKKIIMIEYQPGKFRYSISNAELEYLKQATDILKQNAIEKKSS